VFPRFKSRLILTRSRVPEILDFLRIFPRTGRRFHVSFAPAEVFAQTVAYISIAHLQDPFELIRAADRIWTSLRFWSPSAGLNVGIYGPTEGHACSEHDLGVIHVQARVPPHERDCGGMGVAWPS
jgi:hypothetical protein